MMKGSMLRGLGLAVIGFSAAICSAQQISVYVDGNKVQFTDMQPRYIGGRVMVPLRGVFEEMGATVDWDATSRTVYAHKGNTEVKLPADSKDAWVNERHVTLDVPARIVSGSTMVPLRFVSESLGASVNWFGSTETVRINTLNSEALSGTSGNSALQGNENLHTVVLNSQTVIPVTLNDELSSDASRKGDKFVANVKTESSGYQGLPSGTTVEGVVSYAKPHNGNDPGVLGLDFQRVRLPDGRSYAIDGSLIGLDNGSITKGSDGRLVAKAGKTTDTMTYIGYGAGAGLLVAILGKRNILTDTVLGAAVGYIVGQLQQQHSDPHSVVLNAGTEFGVRLDKSVTLRTM